jgi:SnoaL-like domain
MDLWELAAREAIRETVAAYAHCADSGRFDEFAYLGGVGTDLARDTTIPLIRHHVSNLRIDVTSPAEAGGACYFLAVTEHGVDHWGRYRDRYVPDGDRWLFAHRFVRTDGTTPGGWAASRGYS